MPSKTAKQARFMAMCSHNPQHAAGKCPPASVAREFNQADKGTGILGGGRKAPAQSRPSARRGR